ncbi:thiol-activated cytolysin [Soonwooa buanensis]|uniref:Thiol-activated cytolysin n=1 Tax=Soonwooa buanensis TaxID=619805 RepID=A0A1T5CLX4_9FLAO|nr:thiol-activated cytolysin family protein [Soonwooa buanensis]SKB60356.1 thiol-activated cytolysin [Soonwooa buanensis]
MMNANFFRMPISVAVIAIGLISCNRDDAGGSNGNLNNVQSVKFSTKPDNEISAELTGNTAVINGVPKKEYLVTTEKSDAVMKPALIRESPIETTMLYPGSILQGESFMTGGYDPLVLSNPFKPVDLFLTIKGSSNVAVKSVMPKGSTIFQALSDLRIGNASYFPLEYVPANYTFESTEINNEESFTKATEVHAKANFAKIVSASFDYTNSQTTVNNKKFVMVKLSQNVYSAGIDPKYQADWIDGDIQASQVGKYEPLYISSVDYGRMAYILIETEKQSDEVTKMVKASIEFGIGKIGGSANTSYNTEFKNLFTSNKIKVSILGGSANTIITDYDSFMNYLKLENSANSLISSSAPISYTVRRIKDNTQVEIVNQYKDVKREYR